MSQGIRTRLRLLPLVGGLAAMAVLWSCDGQNLFSPDGMVSDMTPPLVEITQPREPAARPVGDSVLVTVRASDDTGVDSILLAGVAFRGDPDLGTDVTVPRYVTRILRFPGSVRDTTVSRYLVPTADSTREAAYFFALAYDSRGNLSSDTVRVTIGGPRVDILTLQDDQQIQAGLSLNLRVEAADPEGILEMTIQVKGAFEQELRVPFTPPLTSVLVDTVVVIPAGIRGKAEVTAVARNGLGVTGQDGPVALEIVEFSLADQTPPTLSVSQISTPRLEMDDAIRLMVSGADNPQGSGIARAGYTIRAISPRRGDTLVRTGQRTFNPPRTGNLVATFDVLPFNVDPLNLPDSLVFEVTGWAFDAEGNCAAAVEAGASMSLACATLPGGQTAAANRSGFTLNRVVASGRTIDLPGGGRIMDAVVDTLRKNLFLSNLERNHIEVFRLGTETFAPAIGVGSEPWGMTLDRSGNSLFVANSGGVNISEVDLDLEREVDELRFFAPDVVIFDVELKESDSGLRFLIYPFPQAQSPAFSDRPQFLAIDSLGNFIYSTRSTPVGDIGTARKAYFMPGSDRPEVKLFVEHGLNTLAEDFWALAHIDSIGGGEGITLYDHLPGFPHDVIQGVGPLASLFPVETAVGQLRAQGSDVFLQSGARWDIPSFGFSDTTYVTASGDGGWVLVGEGGTDPTGRVMMYRASQGDTTALSSRLRVWDEVINVSDVVRGIGLNYDGTLGVARGMSTYFFDSELQLSGRVELPGTAGGVGAALHPLHANQATGQNPGGQYRPDTHLAFVGTAEGNIDIIDTWRFRRIGQVTLRDVVTGPLRAILPFPEDNAGLNCPTVPVVDRFGNPLGNAVQLYQSGDFVLPIPPGGSTDDACVVVKLFAVTSAEGVVVVPVRKSEILKYHPNR
jgi:hypothetical protein